MPKKTGNPHDIFAISVMKSGVIVGNVPKKISSICSLFLQRRGAIHCGVTGARFYSADLVQGGLEIPCILKFVGDTDSEKVRYSLDKTQKQVSFALSRVKTQTSKQLYYREEGESSVDQEYEAV